MFHLQTIEKHPLTDEQCDEELYRQAIKVPRTVEQYYEILRCDQLVVVEYSIPNKHIWNKYANVLQKVQDSHTSYVYMRVNANALKIGFILTSCIINNQQLLPSLYQGIGNPIPLTPITPEPAQASRAAVREQLPAFAFWRRGRQVRLYGMDISKDCSAGELIEFLIDELNARHY